MYTDEDYAGLMKIADAGMEKEALEPLAISTGNKWGDIGANMALYMTPGVGGVMSAYDAVRNYGDAWSDFRNGKWWKGLGNLGSGVLNTAFAGMNFIGLGAVGAGVKGLAKGVSAGAKAMGAANTAQKAMNFGNKAYKAFSTAGKAVEGGFNSLGTVGKVVAGTGNVGRLGRYGGMAGTMAADMGIQHGLNKAVTAERRRNDALIEHGRKQYQDFLRDYNLSGTTGTRWSSFGSIPGFNYGSSYGTNSSSVYGNPYGVGRQQPYESYGLS